MALHYSIYVPGTTVVYACDARVKIVVLLAFSIAVFLIDTWWGMALAAAVLIALQAVARIAPGRVCTFLVPVFVLAAFTVLFNSVPWSVEGFTRGLFYAVRMVLLVLASFLVCFTTTSNDAVAGFTRLLGPLRVLRVPVDDVSTVLTLVLRFIPAFGRQFMDVRDAQRLRAAHFNDGSVAVRCRAWGAVFVPLFVGLFNRATVVAVAMDARCYGAAGERTRLEEAHFGARDVAALCIVAALCAALVAL